MKYILFLFLTSFSFKSNAPPKEKMLTIFMPPKETYINPEIIVVKDLSVLHPHFRNKVVKFIYECAKQGIDLEVVETYRNPKRQDYLRRKGFSMLHGGKSKHQHYLAVDVVPVKYGWYMWHDKELWEKVGKIGEAQGLFWGGKWEKFTDLPHFEYPIPIDSAHTLPLPDTVLIPLNY